VNIFEQLMKFDDLLAAWLLHATPNTDAERDQMRLVLGLRGQIDHALNRLIAVRLMLAAKDVASVCAELSNATERMEAIEKRIGTAQDIISIVGNFLDAVAFG
jgi:hypothetical protein